MGGREGESGWAVGFLTSREISSQLPTREHITHQNTPKHTSEICRIIRWGTETAKKPLRTCRDTLSALDFGGTWAFPPQRKMCRLLHGFPLGALCVRVWVCEPPPPAKLKKTCEMRVNFGAYYWLWRPGDGEGCISIVWCGKADSAGPDEIETQTRTKVCAHALPSSLPLSRLR